MWAAGAVSPREDSPHRAAPQPLVTRAAQGPAGRRPRRERGTGVAPERTGRSNAVTDDTIVTGDCLQVLPTLPAGCADLVFADPPFNVGYQYDVYRDRRPRAEYLTNVDEWLAAFVRVLKPTGTLCVAIGAEYAGHYQVRLGLHDRNTIVWSYNFGPHQKAKFGRNHVPILHYTKHAKRFVFNAGAVRVESERQRAGDKRADPRGRVPGDVCQFPRVCGTFKERNTAGHGCQMPEALLERLIKATTNPGDLVVDPMCGTGTTLAVAKRLGRKWVGIELSKDYARAARERCEGGDGLLKVAPPLRHLSPCT